jgi:hypothetical protein
MRRPSNTGKKRSGLPSKRGTNGRQNHSLLRSVGLLAASCGGWHSRPSGKDAHPQGEPHARSPLEAMSAITLEGKLYMIEHKRAFKAEDAVRLLKHLMLPEEEAPDGKGEEKRVHR